MESIEPSPDSLAALAPPGASPLNRAMTVLCAYYREFLETDFKKARLPKRKYALRDAKGNRLGIRLERFSQLRRLIASKLEQQTASVSVTAGRYRADLSRSVRAGIERIIEDVDTTGLRRAAAMVPGEIIRSHQASRDFEQAADDARQALENGVRRELVDPVIGLLEPVFGDRNAAGESVGGHQLQGYTDEIVDLLLDEAAEALPAAVADCLVRDDRSAFTAVVEDLCDPGRVQLVLQDYFGHFGAADFFIDLRELLASRQLAENSSIYLNIGEIQYQTHKFPLYYIPLDVEFDGTAIRVEFQGFVYVNKPACDYIAGELTRASGQTVPNPISERIYHLEDGQTFLDMIERTLGKILHGLHCDGQLDPGAAEFQAASGRGFQVSNELSLSLADQSDEAIVNDYEMLMSGLDDGHPLVTGFQSLVSAFLSSNPVSLEREIDAQWRGFSVPERLVFESPLPMAEEQRKLMQAVHNDRSRVILVEGPPGTGKSHSLAALAFDMIQSGRNVLILSDKTEALNVVEGKLNDVIGSVRGSEFDYVNPVLRLGRESANYANIVKTASIQRLKTSLQSFRSSEREFNAEFDGLRTELASDVRERIEAGGSIDLREVSAFHQGEHDYHELVPASRHFHEGELQALAALCHVFTLVDRYRSLFGRLLRGETGEESLHTLRRLQPALQDASADLRDFVQQWPDIDIDRAGQLRDLQRDIEDMRMPLFGYLFRGKRLQQAGRTAADILGRDVGDVRDMRDVLLRAAGVRNDLEELLSGRAADPSLYRDLHACLTAGVELGGRDVEAIEQYLQLDCQALRDCGLPVTVRELLGAAGLQQRKLTEFRQLGKQQRELADKFNAIPEYDYLKMKSDFEDLCAKRITNLIDDRVVRFVEERKNDARLLKDIIRSKSRFPVDKFDALRDAFPVMIAGLRDYANYIPLEKGLFDLVIIDEASQVSIAQALPAILRSRKIVLMGDRKQFGNVKAHTASRALNNAYFQEVREAFAQLESQLDTGLQTRLKNLDVTRSVMDFGEMTSNFTIMLRKHFRGYPEIISFSSKNFYGNALQVLKLRGKPIEDVLEFVISDQPDRNEELRNASKWEADVIIERLEHLLELDDPPSVAVITPFREQQRFVNERVMNHERAIQFRKKLRVAVFTADTCQGEERDVIFYSFVANREHDRLNYVFPTNIEGMTDDEIDGALKFQRLNVAFSRGREKLVFLCSKPIEEFRGATRQVLQHYRHVLDTATSVAAAGQAEAESPIEATLLQWLSSTSFAAKHRENLQIIPQFPVGEYLRSIDPAYLHPDYKVDFLLRLKSGDGVQQVILEYDCFEHHFRKTGHVDGAHWQHYLLDSDVEREAVLEGYGYKMVRVNRFNIGEDPVASLDRRLDEAFGVLDAAANENEVLFGIKERTETHRRGLEEGTHKTCSRCGEIKPINQFRDASLKSGIGRICNPCKGRSRRA